jgi:hypothetical protein
MGAKTFLHERQKSTCEESDSRGKMDLRGRFHLHTQAEINLVKLGLYLALDSVDLRLETTALTLKVLRQPLSVRKVFCRKDSGFWV